MRLNLMTKREKKKDRHEIFMQITKKTLYV